MLQNPAILEIGIVVEGLKSEFAEHLSNLTSLEIRLVEWVAHTRCWLFFVVVQWFITHG